jgi:pimeloyl-ACP methyl ester carboxylesterase
MWIVVLLLATWLIVAQSGWWCRTTDADAEKEFRKAGLTLKIRTLTNGTVPLHYAQIGNDSLPTLVFVHGSPGSWSAFKAYLKDADLLQKFRMVSIDRPGFGYSHFGDALPLQDQAQAILPLFSVLQNGRPIYLIGHSYAGPLIVALAAQQPDNLTGIVVVAGSINSGDERAERWRRLFFKTPLGLLLPGVWRTSNAEIWYLKKDLKTLVPDFKKVRCAVWLMHGTGDKLVPYHNMAWGSKMFTSASRVTQITVPNAGHFLPWEHYDELKKLLLQL